MRALKQKDTSGWFTARCEHVLDVLNLSAGSVYDRRAESRFDRGALINKVWIRKVHTGDQHLQKTFDVLLSGGEAIDVEKIVDDSSRGLGGHANRCGPCV